MKDQITNKTILKKKYVNHSYFLTSLLSASLLAACGGGGGGESDSQNVQTIQADLPKTGWTVDSADKVATVPVSMTSELCDSGVDEKCQPDTINTASDNSTTSAANTATATTAVAIPKECGTFSGTKKYGTTPFEKIYFIGETWIFNPGFKAENIPPTHEQYGSILWTKDPSNSCKGLAAQKIASSQLVELKYAPPIGDQKGAGTCSAWAASVVLSNMANQLGKRTSIADRSKLENIVSPRHLYTQLPDPTTPSRLEDKKICWGSSGLQIFETVFKMKGAGSLKSAPYAPIGNSGNANDCLYSVYEKNATAWDADKTKFSIAGIRKVPLEVDKIKAEIKAGNALFFGAKLNKAFYDSAPSKVLTRKDFLNAQQSSDAHAGGHAMAIVGYDDGIKAFKVQNSWGQQFGEAGYIFIDYDLMVDSTNFALEKNFYTVVPSAKATADNWAVTTLKSSMGQKSIASLYIDPKNAGNITTQASRSNDQISLSFVNDNLQINNPGNSTRISDGDPLQYTQAELVAAALQHLSKLK